MRFARAAWRGIVSGFPELIPPPPPYRLSGPQYEQITQELNDMDMAAQPEQQQQEGGQ